MSTMRLRPTWSEPAEPDPVEASSSALVEEAVASIRLRLRAGEPAEPVVTEVIRLAFGAGDRHPDAGGAPPGARRPLCARADVDRIVAAVLDIVTA